MTSHNNSVEDLKCKKSESLKKAGTLEIIDLGSYILLLLTLIQIVKNARKVEEQRICHVPGFAQTDVVQSALLLPLQRQF